MPRPPEREAFESGRMKIRRGTLRLRRESAPEDAIPLEPDELYAGVDGAPFDDSKKEPPTPEGAGG
jgi:hypothetical protein